MERNIDRIKNQFEDSIEMRNDAFVSLVDSMSDDEMRGETEHAVLDSNDSYILGDMDHLSDL